MYVKGWKIRYLTRPHMMCATTDSHGVFFFWQEIGPHTRNACWCFENCGASVVLTHYSLLPFSTWLDFWISTFILDIDRRGVFFWSPGNVCIDSSTYVIVIVKEARDYRDYYLLFYYQKKKKKEKKNKRNCLIKH